MNLILHINTRIYIHTLACVYLQVIYNRRQNNHFRTQQIITRLQRQHHSQ